MKPRLLNSYEEVTYDALNSVCSADGARVFPKVRIADVFSLKGSGVSAARYSYGLRAHFDFLVTDDNYKPLFSVEFDGPLHKLDSTQKQRDKLKNDLCDHFHHSLLRINSNYLTKQYRGLDLLTYFVEAWFLERAFIEAQEKGLVPYEESFDMTFIYSDGRKPHQKWPYWLSLDIQNAIQELHEQRQIGQPVSSHYTGYDDEENYRCLSWLVLDATSVVFVKTGMRKQRFPAVSEDDLINMLAMFDLYEKLQRVLRGKPGLRVDCKYFFERILPEFQKTYHMASMGCYGSTL